MKNFFENLNKCFIIAEIGVNHNGSLRNAFKMVDSAKACGADAVKFQTFKAKTLAKRDTPKVAYQKIATPECESHYEMLEKLELTPNDFSLIFDHCRKINIEFISTPYDIESADFLNKLGIKIFKTASADITDHELHHFLAKIDKPVIISTGMSSLADVEGVIDVYQSHQMQEIALLHCVSNYPCANESINLRAMTTLAAAFKLPIGYSDHSEGSLASCLSIALGAKIIEKHFTLDKKSAGPDHSASSDPIEFKKLVDDVRKSELILGGFKKTIQKEEIQMSKISRKSIYLKCEMKANQTIRRDDLDIIRPGDGISPIYLNKIIGSRLIKSLPKGHKLSWQDIIA